LLSLNNINTRFTGEVSAASALAAEMRAINITKAIGPQDWHAVVIASDATWSVNP